MGSLLGCMDHDFSYLNNSQQVESNGIRALSSFGHPRMSTVGHNLTLLYQLGSGLLDAKLL